MNFGVRVSDNINKNRNAEEVRASAATLYVMLGGSNCDRLGDTLVAMDKTVLKITKGGWRPTRQAVEAMVEAIKGKVDKSVVVVLMGLDNGSCYEEGEDETRLECITYCASNFPLLLLSKTITKFFYFQFSCFAF